MARTAEPGISYYKMLCRHTSNKKVRLLHNEFDSHGYWIWQCLIDEAYTTKGYYFDCNDKDALELFASDVAKKPVSLVNEVIQGCVRRGLFERSLFDAFNICTSAMMQEIYIDATHERRRKGTQIKLVHEFLLVEIPAKEPNFLFVPWKKENIPRNNSIIPVNNPHSIVEYSRVENFAHRNGAPQNEEIENTWEALVQQWKCFFNEKFGTEPGFKGRDPKILKNIVRSLQERSEKQKQPWDIDSAPKILKKFLSHAFIDPWLAQHFLLKNLDEQFDHILTLDKPEIPKPREKISKTEVDLNFLFERFCEDESHVTIISIETAYYDYLKKKGFANFSNGDVENIRMKAHEELKIAGKKPVGEELLGFMKRVSVLEIFKELKQQGKEALFYVE